MINKPLFFFFAALLLLLAILPLSAAAEVRVVATTGDLAAMARAIVQEDGEVDYLVRPSEDPHFVDPRPSYARLLNRADIVAYVGMDLEVGWLPVLITRSRNTAIQAGQPGHFEAARFVRAMDVATGRVDRSMGDVHPEGNPHFTTDPRQMARIALAFGQALGQIRPEKADLFQERARDFARDSIRLAQTWEQNFAELPDDARQIITYHKSWTYLTDWLRLDDVIQVEPRPGVPPNPRHIARLVDTVNSRNIGVLLQLEYYPRTTANTLAERTGITLVQVPAQTRENQTYFEHIEEILQPLFEALLEASRS